MPSNLAFPANATWVHTMALDVQIFDTDCFGVMWHGSYLKWMEMGRAKLLEDLGITIALPGEANGHIYPVAEQSLKFKNRAPYREPLILTTRLEVESFKLLFYQTFRSANDDRVTLDAVTTVLVLDGDWKIQRRLPDFLQQALAKGLSASLTT